MSEKTKVWIRTSLLDIIVFGKSHTSTKRAIPGAGAGSGASVCDDATYYSSYTIGSSMSDGGGGGGGGGDDDGSCQNWGWSRGYIVNDDGNGNGNGNSANASSLSKNVSATSNGNGNTNGNGGNGNDEMIKVYITDEESVHCNTEVTIPFHVAFSKGDLVMDNTYGDHHQHLYFDDSDDEGEDGDDYGYDSYNYGGGGGGSNNDNNNKGKPEDKYPNDLITLTHLHEPSVVYCLRKRYSFDKIYTSTGPILIALNPFKNCKALYSEAVMKQYWNRGEKRMKLISSSSSNSKDKKNNTGSSGGDDDETDSSNELPPHVYATADHSFRSMMTKLEENKNSNGSSTSSRGTAGGVGRRGPNSLSSPSSSNKNNKSSSDCINQSILVSGESGAGKTVTTKFIMQYLATLSKRGAGGGGGRRRSLTTSGDQIDIEQQVLQSNPILESFGNARTIRNDNSSRFGKFIEIQFTDTGNLVGANIETYLLEKVRLVSQADGERNYHIFYEILSGMEGDDLDRYYLSDYTAEDFKMTNQSDTYDRRDGVGDYDTFQDLTHAMETMGFASTEKADIMSVTCALLHASNLTLNSINAGDESEIDRSNAHLEPMLSLLGIDADTLNRALCYFSIVAGREKHTRSNSKEKAEKGLLALIKATYGALFTYVVKRVNESITVEDKSAARGGGASGRSRGSDVRSSRGAASIGVLDIFGFESFKSNSFEQLCINYCNEALQQQFNMFVLKNEQDEYEKEGIQWSFISFPDNQDALDLIDKKGSGILSILDDQCRAPGTTDKTFINDIYQKLSRHSRFEANRRQVGARKFAIIHYAGTVEYGSKGFVEKNRDDLPKETTDLLLSSSNEFVKKLAQIINGSSGAASSSKSRIPSKNSKLTVGGQFSRQLHELRQKIDNTQPHYVRCLKPNDELIPDHFDPLIIADQLRCAGVIEAVRVSRVGYPQRYTHARFLARYRILGQQALKQAARLSRRRKPVDVLVEAIAVQINQLESGKEQSDTETVDLVSVGIQVGKTKVFLRRKAYEALEQLRNRQMRNGAIKIQSLGRCYIVKKEYTQSRNAIITLQCSIRSAIARSVVHEKRRNYNAVRIQTAYRRAVARRIFVSIKICSHWLQKRHRGNVGRLRYQSLNRDRKAILIQKFWRMYITSKQYQRMKVASLTIQCAWRCAQSRKQLRELRIAARDLNNTAQERDMLREENRRLQKALADALGKSNSAEANANNFENEKKEFLTQIKQLEDSCDSKDKTIGEQKVNLESLQAELKLASDQIDGYENQKSKEITNALAQVSEAENNVKNLQNERSEFLSKIQQLEEKCTSNDKERNEQKLEIEKLRDELAVSFRKNKQQDENAGQELADAENRANVAENDVKCLEAERNEILSQIHQLKELCASREKEIEEQKLQIEELQIGQEAKPSVDEVEALIETVNRANIAEENAKNLESEKLELNSRINQLEDECAAKDIEANRLKDDIEKLNQELKSLSEQMDRLRTVESKASREMEKLIADKSVEYDDASEPDSNPISPMFSLAAESKEENEKDTYIATLEEELNGLKKKLSETNKTPAKTKSNASLQKEVDKLKKKLTEAKKNSADEILTLQDEVQRLNKELRIVKTNKQNDMMEVCSDIGCDSSIKSDGSDDQQADEFLNHANNGSDSHDNQLNKLVDSLMAKDAEIRQLRQEIAMLKDQLDEATMSMLSDSRMNDDMDDRSVISKIFTRTPYHQKSSARSVSGSVRSYGMDETKMSLRKANMELKKELEEIKDELEACKFELEHEREKSGREIKAFGDALKGVDELRTAAEAMSREIIRLKQRDDDEVPEDPFQEVNRGDSFDNEGNVHRMQKAKRMIGTASLKSEQPSIWSKMRLSVRSLNEDVIPEESDYKGRKNQRRDRGRDNDDSSVFTSFF